MENSGTRASMEAAYLRPRAAWVPGFQSAAAEQVHAYLRGESSAGEVLDGLEALYRQVVC